MVATAVSATWRFTQRHLRFATGAPFPALEHDGDAVDYDDAYDAIVRAMAGAFYGPPRGGVYSPGVQATLYDMGTAALAACAPLAHVELSMPNLHFIPAKAQTEGVQFEDDVYVPVSEPHGLIEACVRRGE
mmetsp:Transcript_14448/g.35739  ORF Transcript_14448/g.35739 Transcript_14448/m.35739 type:complete len:131 (+) Transcript_14448:1612-2004(+)